MEGNEYLGIQAIFSSEIKTNDNYEMPCFLNVEEISKVRNFHRTVDSCKRTPLVKLTFLSGELGVKEIFVKDESRRGGLNSFKVLGSSFAIAKLLCKKLSLNIEEVNFEYLKSEEVKRETGPITFATCSDGNHGRGVAWTARELGQKAVIYLPKGSTCSRVEAIRELGAEAIVIDLNYDDTIRYAVKMAKQNNWEIVQDTSWEGYEEIPKWIMQGYAAMAYEAIEQLEETGINKPSHMFIQAGVGAMAGAVLGFCANYYNGKPPITMVMEPVNAACIYESVKENDGNVHCVTGELETIMAGLACGEPILEGFKILRDFAAALCKCPDYVTARGMRILANPIGSDERIFSGESGAIGTGLLSLLMQKKELCEYKEKLGLNSNSTVLLFSTEGATDPVNYRNILWDGKYSVPL